nr:TlpA family protein disulfide reductase [Campylobacter sp.]
MKIIQILVVFIIVLMPNLINSEDFGDKFELSLDNGNKLWLQKRQNGFLITQNAINLQNNQAILFLFFTTWCPSCKQEYPKFSQIGIDYPNLRVIGVLLENRTKTDIIRFKNAFKIDYEIVTSGYEKFSKNLGGIIGTPTTILLDKQGEIIYKKLGTNDIDELNKAIKEVN